MASDGQPPRRPQQPSQSTTPRHPSVATSIQEESEDESASPTTIRAAPATSNPRREYGTLDSLDATNSLRQRPAGSRGQGSSYFRRDVAASSSMAPLSPTTSRAQRPPNARRMSTKRQLPHRGEQFSVDDDASEVEEDLQLERAQTRQTPQPSDFPALSRAVSTVRRRTTHVPQLPRVDSQGEDEIPSEPVEAPREEPDSLLDQTPEDEQTVAEEDAEDDDAESDAESFTLKDRQLAINETHPFGIRIWKPAIYKKNRSVEKDAEEDIHSSPSAAVSNWLWLFNMVYTCLFGWWLATIAASSALICFLFSFDSSAAAYARTYWGLADYLFWPFGKFVKLEQDDNYAEEDEGEGRSISEYERWQSGDLEYGRLMFGPHVTHVSNRGSIVGRHRNSMDSVSERDALLDRHSHGGNDDDNDDNALLHMKKRRLFGRGQWTIGRIVFYACYYALLGPFMLLCAAICWFFVFFIPMCRVLTILLGHLRKRPLALTFHTEVTVARDSSRSSSIILCTYRAAGLKYWKYTYDGQNVILLNSLAIVAYTNLAFFIFHKALGYSGALVHPALMFVSGLISIIPLAYFIGEAVASISAQSTMGVGAAINAFFSTIVEVFLYCVALQQGKGSLVEGSIIGSIFAGILVLPGVSMVAGAIKRKTQRFNQRSAGATQTLMFFAMIGVFGPTLFYKIYGGHEVICKSCSTNADDRDCRQCYFRQVPATTDDFFVHQVRYYTWIVAVGLLCAFIIGILFTLRTHAATIWQIEIDEKRPVPEVPTTEISPADTRQQSVQNSQTLPGTPGFPAVKPAIRDSQLYKRILGQTQRASGLNLSESCDTSRNASGVDAIDQQTKKNLPHVVPPKDFADGAVSMPIVPGLSEEQNRTLVKQVAELAATAATVAARDAVSNPRQASYMITHTGKPDKPDKPRPSTARLSTVLDIPPPLAGGVPQPTGAAEPDAAGGHDAPNWSRKKSAIILLSATVAYAAVAEVLVDTVDYFLQSFPIDQKFLGFTLFALVPNTTEFLNAISFAMHGNVSLSMEIGSAYTLQVVLLQIPCLVAFTAIFSSVTDITDISDYTFNLIFPQWDMITVILSVLLYTHMLNEGKSNYFKGSIMLLTYVILLMGFFLSGNIDIDNLGADMSNTLALPSAAFQSHRHIVEL